MAGVLTAGNASLEPSEPSAISARLDPGAGLSEHRGVGRSLHNVRGSRVYLVPSLSKANVELLRQEGYKIYMFSEYAPTAAIHGHGYDPYALGIKVLPILEPRAFYKPAVDGDR